MKESFWTFEIVTLGSTSITVAMVATAVGLVVAAILASKVAGRLIRRGFRSRGIQAEGSIAATSRLAHYLILIVGLTSAFQTLGIDLSALFAAGALFAVALGFAMKAVVENFVSGVILLVERAIKPGDILKVDGEIIRVVRMGIRATVARSLDDEDLIIPNGNLVQATVRNYTFADLHHRVRVRVGVSYRSDMAAVKAALVEAAARGCPEAVRAPIIRLVDYGDSAVIFELATWTETPFEDAHTKSQLNWAIWNVFLERSITIAYPQLDLHLDAGILTGELRAISDVPSAS